MKQTNGTKQHGTQGMKRRSGRTWAAAALAPAALLASAALLTAAPTGAVATGDTECRGALGAVTVVGNLIVPDDATCALTGTQIQGSITVKSRATLHASGINLTGSLQGESPTEVMVNSNSVIGNGVSVRKSAATLPAGSTTSVTFDGDSIVGDVALEENMGKVNLTGNRVGGSIQANKNVGGLFISTNRIVNGLQCQDNAPAPTGGGNIAKQKQGQCMNL